VVEVVDVEPPERVSGGFDFWVYGLHFSGSGLVGPWAEPLIARIPAVASRYPSLQQESRVLRWVAAQGYPAPPMLELIPPGELFDSPVQVMKRLAGITMAQAMTSAPWQATRWARRLGAAHVALHRLPGPDGVDGSGPSLAEQRLRLTRRMVARHPDSGLAKALERIEPVLPRLDISSPTVCHGDFHPGNLLVEPGTVQTGMVAAIDWTDAGIGDRHGDIARTAWLFSFAAAVARSGVERLVLRAQRRACRALTFLPTGASCRSTRSGCGCGCR
jgi:aminoglycoside phosphotransferase (APT) family kinase protein